LVTANPASDNLTGRLFDPQQLAFQLRYLAAMAANKHSKRALIQRNAKESQQAQLRTGRAE
jgi:hypothetical protein